MGAHSAGRRVHAPGRWTRLNRALEFIACAGVLTWVAYTGFVTADAPVTAPGWPVKAGPPTLRVISPPSPVPARPSAVVDVPAAPAGIAETATSGTRSKSKHSSRPGHS